MVHLVNDHPRHGCHVFYLLYFLDPHSYLPTAAIHRKPRIARFYVDVATTVLIKK